MAYNWTIISWVAIIIAIIAYIFNIKKNKSCFVLWEIAAVLLILVNLFGTHDYAQMTLNIVYMGFNACGWLKWRKDELEDDDLMGD